MDNKAEGSNNSRKEDILARSRQMHQDEGVAHAISKGSLLGNYYTGVVGIALIFIAIYAGEALVVYAVLTLYGAHCFGEFLAKYRHFRQNMYLVGMILFGVIGGGFFAFLFLREIGILQGWVG